MKAVGASAALAAALLVGVSSCYYPPPPPPPPPTPPYVKAVPPPPAARRHCPRGKHWVGNHQNGFWIKGHCAPGPARSITEGADTIAQMYKELEKACRRDPSAIAELKAGRFDCRAFQDGRNLQD